MNPRSGAESISLARFVLDTVEQVQALAEQSSTDFAVVSISSVTVSVPYDAGTDTPRDVRPDLPLRKAELKAYLEANERSVRLDRDRLLKVPRKRLARIELTVRFQD